MNRIEAQSILHLETDKFSNNILKLAYRKCASQCHPDKGGSDEDMKAVNEAYSVLSKYTVKIHQEKPKACDIKKCLRAELNVIQNKEGTTYNIELGYNRTLEFLQL